MEKPHIMARIVAELAEIGELDPAELTAETPLIGEDAAIQSHGLVELLLALEDFAEDELGVPFDWTGDTALSLDKSPFRTVGTLTDCLADLTP